MSRYRDIKVKYNVMQEEEKPAETAEAPVAEAPVQD